MKKTDTVGGEDWSQIELHSTGTLKNIIAILVSAVLIVQKAAICK